MRRLLPLLTLVLLANGCLIKETTHSLYIEPDDKCCVSFQLQIAASKNNPQLHAEGPSRVLSQEFVNDERYSYDQLPLPLALSLLRGMR